MTNSSVTACARCREQKLRCSREHPDCARCSRFGATCTYPPPPDRKVLAATRSRCKKRSAVISKQRPKTDDLVLDTRPRDQAQVSTTYDETNARPSVDAGVQSLSPAIHDLFQETYFTCQFHASLLFHRRSFNEAFKTDCVPQHVLLAMYASATIFLPPESSVVVRHSDILLPLGDLKAVGRQYALRAGRTVLQDVDQPTFESVQTCEMLSLYWFSVGDYQRNTIFLTIAWKAACILGLDGENGSSCLRKTNTLLNELPDWLVAEMARRCFWAVWFTQNINSDHYVAGASLMRNVMKLPLPMTEKAFSTGREGSYVTLSTIIDNENSISAAGKQPIRDSIFGELMAGMLFWAKIRNLVELRTELQARDWLFRIYEVDSQLTTWYSGIINQFSYTKRNLYEQLVHSQQSPFLFLHALYNQSRTVLHSFLVPQFSGLVLSDVIPAEVTRLSARIALKSAQEISSLGADIVALDWDPTQVPGFVGYCMYVSASIHIAMLGSEDPTLQRIARSNLVSNLKCLKSMRMYWCHIEKLWLRVNVLYEAQISRLRVNDASTEGINSGGLLACPTQASPRKDFDHFACEVRKANQLSEPLAESVLEYSLFRLRPTTVVVHSGLIYELEEAILKDQLEDSSKPNPRETEAHYLLAASALFESGPDWLGTTSQNLAPQLYSWGCWGIGLDAFATTNFAL